MKASIPAWVRGVRCISFACLLALPAGAQTRPPAPDAGVLLRESEREQRRRPPSEEPAPIEIPRVQQAPAEAADLRFRLDFVSLEGATMFLHDDLEPFWAPLLGSEISLGDLYRVAEAITAKYRNEGYVLSLAVVPAQEVDRGRVRLQVIEGFVSEVVVEGDTAPFRGFVDAQARAIERSRPLRASALERALLLINDLPGLYARAVLAPAEKSGASKLLLRVGQTHVDAFAQFNNSGSRFNGPNRVDAGLGLSNVLGLHESTRARISTTVENDEFLLLQGSHVQYLGPWGTTLDGSITWVEAEPGSSLRVFELESDSLAISGGLSHPFVRTRPITWTGFARFDYLDSESEILGTRQSEDQVRAARVGTSLDFVDSCWGINRVEVVGSQGLPILDHSEEGDPLISRPGGSSEHAKVEGSFSRLQGLFPGLNLRVEVEGQYAFDDLLASEEFVYGGRRIGRGYDVGELSGDSGVAALGELQYGFGLPWAIFQSAQLFGAYDIGVVWNREGRARDANGQRLVPDGRDAVADSASGGVRVNLTTWLSGEGQVAVPLMREPTIDDGDRGEPRFFFTVTARWPAD